MNLRKLTEKSMLFLNAIHFHYEIQKWFNFHSETLQTFEHSGQISMIFLNSKKKNISCLGDNRWWWFGIFVLIFFYVFQALNVWKLMIIEFTMFERKLMHLEFDLVALIRIVLFEGFLSTNQKNSLKKSECFIQYDKNTLKFHYFVMLRVWNHWYFFLVCMFHIDDAIIPPLSCKQKIRIRTVKYTLIVCGIYSIHSEYCPMRSGDVSTEVVLSNGEDMNMFECIGKERERVSPSKTSTQTHTHMQHTTSYTYQSNNIATYTILRKNLFLHVASKYLENGD